MDEARRRVYRTLIGLLQQTAGSQYTVAVAPKERPDSTSKDLGDGMTLNVGISWQYDAPRVTWAEIVLMVNGESSGIELPPELIRLTAVRERQDREE